MFFFWKGDWCYVNIDNNDIEVPEEMPNFPKFTEFRSEICTLLKKNGIPIKTINSAKAYNTMASSIAVIGSEGEWKKINFGLVVYYVLLK